MTHKPVGVYIPAPRPNFGHSGRLEESSPEVQWIADFLQAGAELPTAECSTTGGDVHGNVALSQAILGSKFWALGGLNRKSKNNVL